MAGVSVEVSAVAGAISLCQRTISEFQKTANSMNSKCQAASSSWKDDKYRQFEGVVQDCTKALNAPVKELEDCIVSLTNLKKAIEEYEQTSIK